ncbi:hypothetical protein [Streptomyces sp. NPDC057052]|uniref:hypothetical protein n=1 Tax=Streptomyces sp. NPDC057052 TaxID=3346010 RepID=UPI003634B874
MTAPAPSLEAILAAGGTVKVPGLLDWLGYTWRPVDPDYQASLDGGFTEFFEDYCTRISKEEA